MLRKALKHILVPGEDAFAPGTGTERTDWGAALFMVVIMLAVMAVFAQSFVTETSVDLLSARAERDKVKAQFLAYSAMEVTQLMLKVQSKYLDRLSSMGGGLMSSMDIEALTQMLMPAFFSSGGLVHQIAGGELKGLGLTEGYGTAGLIGMEREDGRVNLNCAQTVSDTDPRVQAIAKILMGMFSDRRYDDLFQRTLPDGDQITREDMVAQIIDYVDLDQSKFGAPGAPEDDRYAMYEEPYEPKNNLFDTVGELALVRGVDDFFMANFGRSFTVYGTCKINLCAVDEDDWELVAGLIIATAKDAGSPVLGDPVKLKQLVSTIMPQLKAICSSPQTFAQAVANPGFGAQAVGAMLGVDIEHTSDLGGDGVQDSEVQGVELDTSKLNQLIFSGPTRFYRIKVFGTVKQTRYEIDAVWDQKLISPSTGKVGGFVYWREE